MKSILSISSLVAAAAVFVSASPFEPRAAAAAQVAHLTFQAGPASYKLNVPADGTQVKTSETFLPSSIRVTPRSLSLSHIDQFLGSK